jgi:hypothetical protein
MVRRLNFKEGEKQDDTELLVKLNFARLSNEWWIKKRKIHL